MGRLDAGPACDNIDAMNDADLRAILCREEKRYGKAWNPATRWKVIQDTITWAEAQSTVQRNDPTKRHAEEMVKLRRMQSITRSK